MPTELKILSESDWSLFDDLFAANGGVDGGCWCTFTLLRASEFNRLTPDARRERQRETVAAEERTGQKYGALLIADGAAVAWCQFGRAELFEFYKHAKSYAALPEELKVPVDWRITCLFVASSARKRGHARTLLEGAIATIREAGGGLVEAFPEPREPGKRPSFAGSVDLFEALGFVQLAPYGSRHVLMRAQLAQAS